MKKIPSALIGLIFFAVSCILLLSLISYTPEDLEFLSFPPNKTFHNLAGVTGAYIAFFLMFMFGYGSFFIPFYLFFSGLSKIGLVRFYGFARGKLIKLFSFLLFICFICSLIGIFFTEHHQLYSYSGLVGFSLSVFFRRYLGFWGSFVLLSIIVVALSWLLAGFFFADLFVFLRNAALKAASGINYLIKKIFEKEPALKTPKAPKPTLRQRIQIFRQKEAAETKPKIKLYRPKAASASATKKEDDFYPRKEVKKSFQDKESQQVPTSLKPFDPKEFKLPSIDILTF